VFFWIGFPPKWSAPSFIPKATLPALNDTCSIRKKRPNNRTVGMAKYRLMQDLVNNADAVARTQKVMISGFIDSACRALLPTR